MYIHQQAQWPNFYWQQAELTELLAAVRHQQGRLLGRMEALGFPLREEAALRTLTQEITQSSEIEGQTLDNEQVRSSIARHLGMDVGGLVPASRDVEGIVEMMLDATRHYDAPLSAERLFDWHAALFPTGRSGMARIRVAAWRDDHTGPMQVVSGHLGRERVHYEAPPAAKLAEEMDRFLVWFNQDESFQGSASLVVQMDPVLKAAVAHFWFVTLHPFDDGNGRIARAIADMALARSEQSAQRFYSMSAQIRQERTAYYDLLEKSQKGPLDITPWMRWFLECLGRAIAGAESTLGTVLRKAHFWERFAAQPLNERQRLVLNRLLDGFEGNLTTSKWAKLTNCSQDTAYRDILDLQERAILVKNGSGGRSTSYFLVEI